MEERRRTDGGSIYGARRGHNLAVQITTDMPVWGGLSGCTFEEAQSWGKITKRAPMATCYSNVTIALPLMARALAQRLRKLRRTVPYFEWSSGDLYRIVVVGLEFLHFFGSQIEHTFNNLHEAINKFGRSLGDQY